MSNEVKVRLPGGAVIFVLLPHDADCLDDWVHTSPYNKSLDKDDHKAVIDALEADIAFHKANP